MGKMTPARKRPDTYVCEECGRLFVLVFEQEKLIQCALAGEGHHCHVGEYLYDSEGRQIAWVTPGSCLPYSTTE